MPYEQAVKDIAYSLDPACWESYSGKSRGYKAMMERRRTRTLDRAQRIHEARTEVEQEEKISGMTLEERVAVLEERVRDLERILG